MEEYDFFERLEWSNGHMSGGIERILKARIPACIDIEKASLQQDKDGTDYWAIRSHPLRQLSVDVKIRDEDWATRGFDDLALETWSVLHSAIGWTRNPKKHTDFILWYWQDTRRFCLVPFQPLCKAFSREWETLREKHKVATQSSGDWQSECVFVPRVYVHDMITRWQNGRIPDK